MGLAGSERVGITIKTVVHRNKLVEVLSDNFNERF